MVKPMKPCQFATYLTGAPKSCGVASTTSVQLFPHYDTVMCSEHAAIFTEKDSWAKTAL